MQTKVEAARIATERAPRNGYAWTRLAELEFSFGRTKAAREALDEAALTPWLAMAYAPEPDLFIRTGGEQRISNFLLWQSAYAEFHFTDCLWPDFDAKALDKALHDYAQRERRFGDVGESGQGHGALGMGNEAQASEGPR